MLKTPLHRVLPVAIPILVFAVIFLLRIIQINDPDVFLHIRSGWWIVENQKIPSTDPFALFSLGMVWVNHQWLSQIAIALLSVPALGGLVLLSFARAAILTLSYYLLYRAARIRGASMAAALLAVWLGSLAAWNFSEPRPYLATYLFLAWTVWAWSAWKIRGSRAMYALPLVMLIWANSHGGATAGLLFLGAVTVGEFISHLFQREKTKTAQSRRHLRTLLLLLVATILVSFISPHGWRILIFPFRIVGKDLLETAIFEWNPPNLKFIFWVYWSYLILFALSVVVRFRSLSIADAIVSAGFIYMSLTARRHIPLMVAATIPIFAAQMTAWPACIKSASVRRIMLPGVCALGIILSGIWAFRMVRESYIPLGLGLNPRSQPVEAVDYLLASPLQPNLFHDYNRGGYLIYRLQPPWRAFIDGRVEVYGPENVAAYMALMGGHARWESAFHQYDINTVMLDRQTIERLPELARQLWESDQWAVVYWDDLVILYARTSSVSEDYLAAYQYRVVNPAWSTSELAKRTAMNHTRSAAYKELQRALQQNPRNLHALDDLSNLYAEDGRIDEAEALCRKMLAISPDVTQARYRLARILDKKNELEEAERHYRISLKRHPDQSGVLVRLGTIKERQGNFREAIRFYRKALKVSPDDKTIPTNIERVEERMKSNRP